MIDPLDEITARKTVRDYLCSTCWGHLYLADFAPDRKYVVKCNKCGEDTKGYVTKAFVERRRAESSAEAHDVHQLLEGLGVIDNPHEHKTSKQLLEELGL